MVEVGQIRANELGVRVSVVSRLEATGRFMMSDTPGQMHGPWIAATIETLYPRIVGTTTDPGHYKLLVALEAFFVRMESDGRARNLPTARGPLAAYFGLVDPSDPHGPQLQTRPDGLESMALAGFLRAFTDTPPGANVFSDNIRTFEQIRTSLCEVLGFVERPVPTWAQPGSYVFDPRLGPHGVHLQVLSIEDGVATLQGFPDVAKTQSMGAGLLEAFFQPVNPMVKDGLPCEVCGRRQHLGGCGWAPCTGCRPSLYDRAFVGDIIGVHLWWCRLTIEEKGCTCSEHEEKVPFWNASREGWDAERDGKVIALAKELRAKPEHAALTVETAMAFAHEYAAKVDPPGWDLNAAGWGLVAWQIRSGR